MVKKHKILIGLMAGVFLMSPSGAKAQGWPTFDVAKLSALVMNLAGRYQPIPSGLQRISQVKDIQSQVKGVAAGEISGELKSFGKEALKSVQGDSFSFGKTAVAKAGDSGAAAASKKAEETLFLKGNGQPTSEQIAAMKAARAEANELALNQLAAKSVYMISNGPKENAGRIEKVMKADADAATLQDKVNANTMAVMANNVEMLNQISLLMAKMEYDISTYINDIPPTGYTKPKAPVIEGPSEYNDSFEKDEIDVDLE